jgi:hypothetical protein
MEILTVSSSACIYIRVEYCTIKTMGRLWLFKRMKQEAQGGGVEEDGGREC